MHASPPLTAKPVDRQVMLLLTCLCDAYFADAAQATVEVLEHAGCEAVFPEDQTCCGQPAFNAGDFGASRRIARHALSVLDGSLTVVVPSGSCAAMFTHGNSVQFSGENDADSSTALGHRTWELCDFMVHGLGIRTWSGSFPHRVALHHSSHTRGSGTPAAMDTLLRSIHDLVLLPVGQENQCCGFGKTFSVTLPYVSGAMEPLKLDHAFLPTAISAFATSIHLTWVTGPSRTADVEGILIEGVHGPGFQIAYLTD